MTDVCDPCRSRDAQTAGGSPAAVELLLTDLPRKIEHDRRRHGSSVDALQASEQRARADLRLFEKGGTVQL